MAATVPFLMPYVFKYLENPPISFSDSGSQYCNTTEMILICKGKNFFSDLQVSEGSFEYP